MKRLSILTYKQLRDYNLPSYYKLCAISKAAGILAARKKSIRRGYPAKNPCLKKPILVSCYRFKVSRNSLRVPVGGRQFATIPLNRHTAQVLGSEPKLRVCSFTLTENSLSLCIAKDVPEMEVDGSVGVDRNLNNLTVGNDLQVTCYDLSKATEITETTRSIMKSFRRNDVRIRRSMVGKYGERGKRRVQLLLHGVSKQIVESALKRRQGIVFEDIRDIRRLYRKGNGQGKGYRGEMNSWPYHEIKRQIEYKAQWLGVPVITLTKSETRGTSVTCPQCGERLQGSRELKRKLWCRRCREMFDRDLVAALNISRRGRVRFARSEGVGVEAMVKEPDEDLRWPKVILRVDPTKLTRSHEPKS